MAKTKKNFLTKVGNYISEAYRYNPFTINAWAAATLGVVAGLVLSCTHNGNSNQNTSNPNTTQVTVPTSWSAADSAKKTIPIESAVLTGRVGSTGKAISITGDNPVIIVAKDSAVINYNPQIIAVYDDVQVKVPTPFTPSHKSNHVKSATSQQSNVTLVPVPNPWTSDEPYKQKSPSHAYSGNTKKPYATKKPNKASVHITQKPSSGALPPKGSSIDSTITPKVSDSTTGIEQKCVAIIPSAGDASLKRFQLSKEERGYNVDSNACNYKNN